jgi:hypothetical protein
MLLHVRQRLGDDIVGRGLDRAHWTHFLSGGSMAGVWSSVRVQRRWQAVALPSVFRQSGSSKFVSARTRSVRVDAPGVAESSRRDAPPAEERFSPGNHPARMAPALRRGYRIFT